MPMPSIRWLKTISGSFLPFPEPDPSAPGSPCCRAAGRRGPSSTSSGWRGRVRDQSARANCRRGLRCLDGLLESGPLEFQGQREKCVLGRHCPALFASSKAFRLPRRERYRRTISSCPCRDARHPCSYRPVFRCGNRPSCTHDPHTFAITPVEIAVLLIKLELLGSESATRRNNVRDVLAVEIRTLDGAVVGLGIAHVRPIDMAGSDIHNYAVGKSSAPR